MKKLVFIFLILFALRGEAVCVCEGKIPLKAAFARAEAIFTGQVEEKIWITPFDYLVKVKVKYSWKSVQSEYVWLTSTTSNKECGYNFITGHEYLIYAYRTTNNLLAASKCGPTMPWSAVLKEDLATLGKTIYANEVE